MPHKTYTNEELTKLDNEYVRRRIPLENTDG